MDALAPMPPHEGTTGTTVAREPAPSVRVHALAREPAPSARVHAVAREPLPSARVHAVAREPAPSARLHAVAHEPAPSARLHALAHELAPSARLHALAHEAVPSARVHALAHEAVPSARVHALAHEAVPSARVHAVAHEAVPSVRPHAVAHEPAPSACGRALAHEAAPSARVHAVAHEPAPSARVHALAGEPALSARLHALAAALCARLSMLPAAGRRASSARGFAGLAVLLSALTVTRPVHAMHLADGVLPASSCVLWSALALGFVAWALRRFDRARLYDPQLGALVAMVGAAVFAISCMPVPVPLVGTCSHPCGTGLAAILVGPLLTVLLTTVALLLQALFLAHGGLTTLGADIVSMGLAGGVIGYCVFRGLSRLGFSMFAAAFVAGVLADWATYATTALELAVGLHGKTPFGTLFGSALLAFAPTQLPLGLLEGVLTAGALRWVHKRRPALLERLWLASPGAP